MSALLTHMAVGALIAVALRWPWKWWAPAALLAALPDLDHTRTWLGVPLLTARVTLHNALACIIVPLAVWGFLRWKRPDSAWTKLSAGAPVLMTSHLLLDMIPLDPLGSWGSVALLYPFASSQWMLPLWKINTLDPTAVTPLAILVVILTALIVISIGLAREPSLRPKFILALVLAWLALIPVTAAMGLIVVRPEWSPARLAIEDPYLELPEGRVIATVLHAGGDRAFDLRLDLVSNGSIVSSAAVQRSLMPGERATLSLPAGANLRNETWLSLRLVGLDEHLYAVAVPVKRMQPGGQPAIGSVDNATMRSDSRIVQWEVAPDRSAPLVLRARGDDLAYERLDLGGGAS